MPLNPGSLDAKARGCLCSAKLNHDGQGAGVTGTTNDGKPLWVYTPRCPLHGDEKYRKERA